MTRIALQNQFGRMITLRNAIESLPRRTYKGHVFSLQFITKANGNGWICQYYCSDTRQADERFPPTEGATMERAAFYMYKFFNRKYPEILQYYQR
jgi:hypothetical protein